MIVILFDDDADKTVHTTLEQFQFLLIGHRLAADNSTVQFIQRDIPMQCLAGYRVRYGAHLQQRSY